MPERIRIGRGALTLLHRLLDAAAPEEGCALLLGRRDPAPQPERMVWTLQRTWPCRNVWEPGGERRHRFLIDPREQLHAGRWGRARGLELLGSVHSHPVSAAVPSATDRALAMLPTLMLIRGVAARGARAGEDDGRLSCWWLDPQGPPQQLPWTMDD